MRLAHAATLLAQRVTALAERPDSEHEQAVIRIVVGSGVLFYLALSGALRVDSGYGMWAIGFFSISLGLFGAILLRPGVSVSRRLLGMLTDVSCISYGL